MELRWQPLLGHGSVMLLSYLPDLCLIPSCHFRAPFLVSLTVGDGNLSGPMNWFQEPKDMIAIFDWGPSDGQVASFFPNSHMCM